jgi:predicted negative regulator of RcsB-dependent stress response
MEENIINPENNLKYKSRIKLFYEKNKKKIYLATSIVLLFLILFFFYLSNENKKIQAVSENYITAKIYLANGQNDKARDILKENIFLNHSTYSTMSLFLIINKNLLTDEKEISLLFEHVLTNCKFQKEIKDLLVFKKALFESNYIEEAQLLSSLKPLLEKSSLWKPHVLLLLGDYYFNKNETIKAKEFYSQILGIKNLSQDFYSKVKIQLSLLPDAN